MAFLDRIKRIFQKSTLQDQPGQKEAEIKSTYEISAASEDLHPQISNNDCNFLIPDAYFCRTCGKKFNSFAELEKHHKNQIEETLPQIQEYEQIVSPEFEEGFLCKTCGRTFLTEYELLNHIHRTADILAVQDSNPSTQLIARPPKKGSNSPNIDTQFLNQNQVEVTNLGHERLKIDKFPGKIGYRPKNK
jgi:hypothetical protein